MIQMLVVTVLLSVVVLAVFLGIRRMTPEEKKLTFKWAIRSTCATVVSVAILFVIVQLF